MPNNAVYVNGFENHTGRAENHITVRGSNFLFAICAIMGAAALGCIGWSLTKPRQHRIFFYLCALINFFAAIAYFTMGSNLGWAAVPVEFRRSNPRVGGATRQIFYARYIDWFLTTPLLLLDLLLTCRLPWPSILYTISMNEIMIVTGLIGTLVPSRYKWGFFTFGCAAFLVVVYTIVAEGRQYAKALGADVHRTYIICGVWTIGLWFLYPIAWGLGEGGNVITPDSEAVFYGVLDFLAKPVFSFLLLWGHRHIDIARLGLHIRGAGETALGENLHGAQHEKGHHNGVSNDGTATGVHEPATGPQITPAV